MVLVELRYLIALPILVGAALGWGTLRVRRRDLGLFAALGLGGYTISIGLQFAGTALAGAALGSLITAASPALVTLFAMLWLDERPTWSSGAALILGLTGIVAVIGLPGSRSGGAVMGNVALGVAAAAWAAYTVGSRIGTLRYPPLTVTAWATVFGVLFSLPPALGQAVAEGWSIPSDARLWLGIVYIGTVCTAGAFYLWNKGFEYMPASTGSLYLLAQPVVGGALGSIVLGEHLAPPFFVGALFVLAAVVLAAQSSRRSATRAASL